METLKCPECVDEELVRRVGNLLICQSCDLTFVERANVNNMLDGAVIRILREGEEKCS